VRFVTVRAPEPKLGGLNSRKGVSIRTDPAVDLATGPRATKGEALHSGLRESSPPSPDGPAQLVNNYLNWACTRSRGNRVRCFDGTGVSHGKALEGVRLIKDADQGACRIVSFGQPSRIFIRELNVQPIFRHILT
jgi:hypothetical protein